MNYLIVLARFMNYIRSKQIDFLIANSKQMKNTSKVLIALGAGLAIGGILGVLFAPDKGENTRHKIAENGKKLADQFKRKVKEGKEKMEEQLSRVNGELEEVI
jgi:gas vesicle protein